MLEKVSQRGCGLKTGPGPELCDVAGPDLSRGLDSDLQMSLTA